MKGQPRSEQAFVLRGIRSLDAWLANPACVVLPVTGIAMLLVGDIPFTTFWVALGIGLYVFMGAFAGIFFSPALRRQIDLVEQEDPGSSACAASVRRTIVTGAITMIPLAAILYLMVIKPTV